MNTRLVLLLAIIAALLAPDAHAQKLRLDKQTFAPGDAIAVHFSAPAKYPDNAWVGVIPSTVRHGSEAENDKFDLSYQYLKGRTTGTLTFAAPDKPGAYDMRMHDTDNGGKEVASVSFTVSAPGAPARLDMDKKVVAPGEKIVVRFKTPGGYADNAWVGIIPSNVRHGSEAENDKFDLSYQYLKGKTSGSLTFTAPAKPGAYDFRMNDTDANGREVATLTFVVK
jgi:hypothetical protein